MVGWLTAKLTHCNPKKFPDLRHVIGGYRQVTDEEVTSIQDLHKKIQKKKEKDGR